MVRGNLIIKGIECPMTTLAKKIFGKSPYLVISKDVDDLHVVGTNLPEKEIKEIVCAHLNVGEASKSDKAYSDIYDDVVKAGGGGFCLYTEHVKAIIVCCGTPERTMYHEMGHSIQAEDLGGEIYKKMSVKSLASGINYLDIHNIIVNENAPEILHLKGPFYLEEDYTIVKETMYIRTNYIQKFKPKEGIEYCNKCKEIKEKIDKNSDYDEKMKKWISEIGEGIVKTCKKVQEVDERSAEEVRKKLCGLYYELLMKHKEINEIFTKKDTV